MQEQGTDGKKKQSEVRSTRRQFLTAAGATGMLVATGVAAITPAGAQSPQQNAMDPVAPAGIKPRGSFDCRFAIAYNNSVIESTRVLMQYYAALAARDLAGMADTLHFPFVTYEGPYAHKIDTREQFMTTPPASMNVTGKGSNMIKEGSYDMLESTEMLVFNPIGVGHTLLYSRYEPNGERIYQCHGMYGITNNDGKWGIEFLSTIFKPGNQVGRDEENVQAAGQAVRDNHRDKVLSRREADLPMVRKMVEYPDPHGSVWIGGSTIPGIEGKPMEPYKIKGVKSRLRFSEGDTQERMAQQTYNMDKFAQVSGAGVGLWANSIEIPETRALYASAEKGHYYSGYYRYTENGTVISEHRYIGCEIRRHGLWYGHDIATTFGQVLYHDWTNDGAHS
jgi:hypothetical protein